MSEFAYKCFMGFMKCNGNSGMLMFSLHRKSEVKWEPEYDYNKNKSSQ